MLLVLLALLPGTLGLVLIFGAAVLTNLLLASLGALLAEYVCLLLRGRRLAALLDFSALVTGFLIALALPPGTHPGIVLLASVLAIMLGKQVFGGLGQNPFNPAMVGYAAVLVSFPAALAIWPAPEPYWQILPGRGADGMTGATPLDAFRFRGDLSSEAFHAGYPLPDPWILINLLFLFGGLCLLAGRIIRWQASAGMLLALFVLALAFNDGGSAGSLGSPAFHCLHGATMLGAFFIVTDPVSAPRQPEALWLFGMGAGALIFAIRTLGGYPDGVAFAVLVMNGLAPLLDRLVLLGKSRSQGANL